MKKEFEIEVPTVPNFVKIKGISSNRDLDTMVPIENLSEKELMQLAEEWKLKLLDKALGKNL